jgi:hypothetical protein
MVSFKDLRVRAVTVCAIVASLAGCARDDGGTSGATGPATPVGEQATTQPAPLLLQGGVAQAGSRAVRVLLTGPDEVRVYSDAAPVSTLRGRIRVEGAGQAVPLRLSARENYLYARLPQPAEPPVSVTVELTDGYLESSESVTLAEISGMPADAFEQAPVAEGEDALGVLAAAVTDLENAIEAGDAPRMAHIAERIGLLADAVTTPSAAVAKEGIADGARKVRAAAEAENVDGAGPGLDEIRQQLNALRVAR